MKYSWVVYVTWYECSGAAFVTMSTYEITELSPTPTLDQTEWSLKLPNEICCRSKTCEELKLPVYRAKVSVVIGCSIPGEYGHENMVMKKMANNCLLFPFYQTNRREKLFIPWYPPRHDVTCLLYYSRHTKINGCEIYPLKLCKHIHRFILCSG